LSDNYNKIIYDEIIYEEILRLKKRGEPAVLITVVQKDGSGPTSVGTKLLCSEEGRIVGTVGGGELEHKAISMAIECIRDGRSYLKSYALDPPRDSQDDQPQRRDEEQLGMICGGKITLFFHLIGAAVGLYIFGGGHIGRALINHLGHQSFNVSLIDNRKEILDEVPEDLRYLTKILTEKYTDGLADLDIRSGAYVVIATHSHELDYQILKGIVEAGNKPAYIGVIASAKKAVAMVDRLREELGSEADLGNLYMPIGLDIGGQAPDEISFSILAEIQAHRYARDGHKHMRGNWK
jgi:xanthine dehydrogenase accessory factor